MSGDENKLKKYRFPETLTNQSRWFGLPLDELIPAAICIGWGITTSKYLFGIGAAVLVYFGIKKLKKGRGSSWLRDLIYGTVAKLAMRQPFVLFKGLTFQKLCLPGAFRPGDHHNKMLRPGLCVVHASPQYL